MSDWNKLKRKFYKKNYRTTFEAGMIDFSPDSMNTVRGGSFKSYDEYLEVQRQSCGKQRRYLEQCYYEHCFDVECKGQIERFDDARGKVLFKRIMISGMHSDGCGFYGKEDHVWTDKAAFGDYSPEDCVRFTAIVYRYLRHGEGKSIDYGLENADSVSKCGSYEVPTDEQLVQQQIEQLVCETCHFHDHCFMGMCVANEQERLHRIETLKSLQPGKFTPFTVLLAYELEYRVMFQNGGIRLDPKSKDYPIMKKLAEICAAHPVHYTGDVEEALVRMAYPENARLYIE